MLRALLLAVLVSAAALALARPSHAGLNEGSAAYRDGDYAAAMVEFMPLALRGNPLAQFNVGVMFHHGQGVERNAATAVEWYTRAAEQGFPEAQNNLGVLLGEGDGIPQDLRAAHDWYLKAAEQGFADAQFNLAVLYYNGQGVEPDMVRAARWFTRAAEQGDANAQINLGVMYFEGQGVERDPRAAHMWFTLAATLAEEEVLQEDALNNAAFVELNLQPEDLATAREMTEAWLLTYPRQEPASTQPLDVASASAGATTFLPAITEGPVRRAPLGEPGDPAGPVPAPPLATPLAEPTSLTAEDGAPETGEEAGVEAAGPMETAALAAEPEAAPPIETATIADEPAADASGETQIAALPVAPPAPDVGTPSTRPISALGHPVPEAPAPAAAAPVPTPGLANAHRVQLASVLSEDGARTEWDNLRRAFPDLLGPLELHVESAEVAGRMRYRVQAGPLDARAAGRLCADLTARSIDCLPVKPNG
jgi:hypothetical protein